MRNSLKSYNRTWDQGYAGRRGLGGGIPATKRADQQGGEPIRRRRILWETAQAWNGGVAE